MHNANRNCVTKNSKEILQKEGHMFYIKDAVSISNEAIPIEVSWTNSNLQNADIMSTLKSSKDKISQIYNEVVTKITECLDSGIDSCNCIGSYLGNENIYASEGGLILSLLPLVNEEGWIKLAYPPSITLEAACHNGFSFLLKDSSNNYFEVFCMLEENIPEYISDLIHEAVHENEELYIATFDKTKALHIPLSNINIAYAGYVEYDNQCNYTVEECMNMYNLSKEDAEAFVSQFKSLSSLKSLFV